MAGNYNWAKRFAKSLYNGFVSAADVTISSKGKFFNLATPYSQPNYIVFNENGDLVGYAQEKPTYESVDISNGRISFKGIETPNEGNLHSLFNNAANTFNYGKFFFGKDISSVKDTTNIRQAMILSDMYSVAKNKRIQELQGHHPAELGGQRFYYVENNAHHGFKVPFSDRTIGSSLDPRDWSFGLLLNRFKTAVTYRIREKYQNIVESKLAGVQLEQAMQKNMQNLLIENYGSDKEAVKAKIQRI